MEFQKRKAATLLALNSSETDKSPKGTVDAPIIPLLNSLNSHPSYFTTSSCSGRISILAQPKHAQVNPSTKKKARGGSWLFVSHDPADPELVLSLLFPSESPTQSSGLVFRFEPLIIAVECVDIEAAQCLVSLAISSGFRESGITSANKKRVIVGIRCSIRMEVPLGESDKLLVSPHYVKFLVGLANEKMEANRKRTESFFKALMETVFLGSTVLDNGDHSCEDGDADNLERMVEDSDNFRRADGEAHIGRAGSCCSLSVIELPIFGEASEKLFLWGHSTCVLNHRNSDILLFGGFGGMGRHARRNDTLLLDPFTGRLRAINAVNAPSPRMGHTASLVGDSVFVIGGRSDPLNILADVWILNIAGNEWKLSECTGSVFPPRHRHAAAVVGSSIYVYGGLNNDTIFSSLYVLNSKNLQWKEVLVDGVQPCARHSHSMVANGSKLFIFGGYNGVKALGDLYSFDVETQVWKKEETSGRSPHARFSHSMFVYKSFIGVIGGCPMRQHSQELALLDLQTLTWKHVTVDYIGKELLVRSTANVVGDDLVMVGGGAACYAFGTKFSKPFKVKLLQLITFEENSHYGGVKNGGVQGQQDGHAETSTCTHGTNFEVDQKQSVASHWVLQLQKKYAKLGKDILKKLGWLDLVRKVHPQKDGLHICFPITENFRAIMSEWLSDDRKVFEGKNEEEKVSLNDISCSKALNLLNNCGATLLEVDDIEFRRAAISPFQILKEAVASLIKHKGLSEELLDQLPTRWERLGDILVLPVACFKDPSWDLIGEELWPTVARSLNTNRLARNGRVAPTGTRDSTLEILVGDDGWVNHRENGILYSFDATKCMFSWGNLSEKIRMANLNCEGEVVVDLFAGIGYFVLPFLVRAQAKFVYACEWNPHAVEALKLNLEANFVSDKCAVLEGDNRITAPRGVADRVCLGLIPSSEGSWVTAVKALRSMGGMLHVHGNVKDTEEGSWIEHVTCSINEIARSEGYLWEVLIEHIERVKWYAPHIRHLVADVRCRRIVR